VEIFVLEPYLSCEPGRGTGKLTETLIIVYLATDEALGGSESPDSLALDFLEDDLTYFFNKVQEGSDLPRR
jgi:hypothetical protein